MDTTERLQKAIDYIEDHLTSTLALVDVAQVACYSAFHFHRLFQMTVGAAVMTYIKNRRLDRAAYELICTDRRILDIALEYGFGTHETFTRAFKRAYQTTPGEYRKTGRHVSIFPCVNLKNSNHHSRGGIHMNPTILSKPEIKVLGYLVRTTQNDDQGQTAIPAFWQRYLKEGLGRTIPNPLHPNTELGVCVDFDCETGDFSYLIGFEVAEEPVIPEGSELAFRTIPPAVYAVFTTPPATAENFSGAIQKTWSAIFQDWFPSSGYVHASTIEFELYDERCAGQDGKQMDIYIPIQKA